MLLLIVGALFVWPRIQALQIPPVPEPAALTEDRVEEIDILLAADAPVRRLGSGPVVLLEASDYQCPYCRVYARKSFPVFRAMAERGELEYLALHTSIEAIHPDAMGRAVAVECAEDFWAEHVPAFDGWRDHWWQVGPLAPSLASCAGAEAHVRSAQALAESLDVTGTPTFFAGYVQPDGSWRFTLRFTGAASADSITKQVI